VRLEIVLIAGAGSRGPAPRHSRIKPAKADPLPDTDRIAEDMQVRLAVNLSMGEPNLLTHQSERPRHRDGHFWHRVNPKIEADVGAYISDENYSRDVKGIRAIRRVIELEREDLTGRVLVGRHFTGDGPIETSYSCFTWLGSVK